MKRGICPKCQSREVYWHKGSRNTSEPIILKDSFWSGKATRPDKYVCTSCGYLEYYLPEADDLQAVKEDWEKV